MHRVEALLEKYRFDLAVKKRGAGNPNPRNAIKKVRKTASDLIEAIEELSDNSDLLLQRHMAKAVQAADVPDYRLTTPLTLMGYAKSMVEAADRALDVLPAKPRSELQWKPSVQNLLLGLGDIWEQASGKPFKSAHEQKGGVMGVKDARVQYSNQTGPYFIGRALSLANVNIGAGQLQKRLPMVRDALARRRQAAP